MKNRFGRLIPPNAPRFIIEADSEGKMPLLLPSASDTTRFSLGVEVYDETTGVKHSGKIHVKRTVLHSTKDLALVIVTPLGKNSDDGKTLDEMLRLDGRSLTLIADHPALRLPESCVPVVISDVYGPSATRIRAVLRRGDDDSLAVRARRIPRMPSRDAILRLIHHDPAA